MNCFVIRAICSKTRGMTSRYLTLSIWTKAIAKVKQQTETNIDEVKKPCQKKQSVPKKKGKSDVKKINTDKQGVRTLGADAHKVKQLEKSAAKSASKIKKVDKAVKAADKSVKTAKNTVKTSNDVAKKTAQAAKATVMEPL